MTEDQYLSLCEKYLKGIATPEEEILIEDYQNSQGLNSNLLGDVGANNKERLKAILHNRLQASGVFQQQAPVVKIRRWPYAAAAAILVFISVGIYLVGNKTSSPAPTLSQHTKPVKNDIQPGTEKAILTLANGSTITLDDAPNGVVSKQGNFAISKSSNGLIINGGKGADNLLADNAFNTITIPRGGKYHITLSDGTKVWLNSSSALTFPATFAGTERMVRVTGEAYFEVAKNDKMPFKIDVNGKQVVEVIGTHFNISAYTDENNITTTLLEGSVKVTYKDKSTYIVPGQMAVNNFGQRIMVKQADLEEVMAWKNDSFIFNNENITSIMRKISRWYDVDVAYKGDMTSINFDGSYSRSKGLASLLKNIELVNKVRFVTEERRVTVIAK
ncbi:FecR domain-containing protein [Mucilaginibacter sp. ZT4R22]|uniref:FecR domain-containing protein n=1 Tax=Mucilaginibacter pankratovii TaxID=2772110 RepID=A0ABR7WK21_9SPHI|nr:FecR family protein [Mucilaginibacter pankratovii]MBD1362670.1 FecR domain-containing protein [Mucilaginibacter pankratovii]